MRNPFAKSWPKAVEARIGGEIVPVAVRVSTRARSYRLSISGLGKPSLTVPASGRWVEAEAFLGRHMAWLEARLKRATRPVAFTPGAVIPVRGLEHVVVPTGSVRGHVEAVPGDTRPLLRVPGHPEHLARRLTDWLKTEARRDLDACVQAHAGRLGVQPGAITLRAQRTRWGSCSSSGRLSFNWRLIHAPPFVLDYVAAHEVAHLVEMNHSAAFWRTVSRTLPDMERGRAWLRAHGQELMAYGATA